MDLPVFLGCRPCRKTSGCGNAREEESTGGLGRARLMIFERAGSVPGDLAGAIPPVANWSLAGLPKSLQA